MWTRPDQITLELCNYGYCIKTGTEPLDLNSLASLGMGWAYLILPILIGVIIGIGISYIYIKRKNDILPNKSN